MSLTKSTKVDTNQYELEIAVERDTFQDAVQKAYHKNVGKMNVPGFRRGHAPRSVIEKLYGEGVFYEDAVNALYPEAYEAAVKEAGIDPVDQANVKVDKVDGDGFTFKATVIVKPQVELTEYKGLKATCYHEKADEKQVDDEIERVRNRNARELTIDDRAAEKDDVANIDFEGFLDGKAFEGGKGEKTDLKLGSGQFIPGFEDQVVGHKTGESFDVNVTFPKDYQAKELAGKDVVFKVKLNAIKKDELPELDDEFAKDVSEFDTLAEYRADVRKHLQEHKDEHAKEDADDDLLDALTDGLKADIPPVMIEHAIDSEVQSFDYRLRSQGLNLQTYLQYTGMDLKKFREGFREGAEKQVKRRLALEKVAELENIAVSDEDIEAEYKRLADEYKVDEKRIHTAVSSDTVAADLKIDRAVDVVKKSAVITDSDEPNPKHQPKPAKAEAAPAAEEAAPEAKEADSSAE